MQNVNTYRSLEEIQARKDVLLAELRNSNKEINKHWKELFGNKNTKRKRNGFSMSSLMSTSVGVFDGIVLLWKLYRKFKR